MTGTRGLNFSSPPGPLPLEWEKTGRAPAGAFMQWYESPRGKQVSTGGTSSIWKGRNGTREDLGHSCRSSMEANLERVLRYLGYRQWLEDDPSIPPLDKDGKWYRYEGRRWDFVDARGNPIKTKTGFYLADLEVWPGFVDRSRPYEVLEVKGYLDASSKTKLSRMAKQFPEIPLELITPERFKELTAGCSSVVAGWE